MEIKRDSYLQKLVEFRFNGMVKVITGIRRCGKSYLLMKLYRDYLLQQGVAPDHIFIINLEQTRDLKFRNPLELASNIRSRVEFQTDDYYLFVDEIQLSDTVPNPYNPQGKRITFYDALNDLRSIPNLDVYVTGSNSKMLSSDILTEFRGRSDEIRVHPLSFAEFYASQGGDKNKAFDDYAFYGGLPFILSRPTDTAKISYLKSLYAEVYLKDIIERKHIERADALNQIVDLLCSSVGSLTNPNKIANTLSSKQMGKISYNTIRSYIDYLEDAFLFSESKQFDIKGKSYLASPSKFYAEDLGLRNARIGFRQQEMTHITENIIYNELILRGYSVDVGIVYATENNGHGNPVKRPREIDFVVSTGAKRVYIQSAYAMETEEKIQTEIRPFKLTGDFFPKIVIRRDTAKRWYDEQGILNINIINFLLDKELI